ncbi:MAG: hypothetical protein QY332_11940 [Anaerolineales bacterium]|nr:MAG: hypothetical protein QY332_11940 [Anaerolineales bacterium]
MRRATTTRLGRPSMASVQVYALRATQPTAVRNDMISISISTPSTAPK